MLEANGYSMVAVYYMKTAMTKIARGAQTIWQRISSCFGSGTWVNESKWSNTEFWKNS